jgi:acyl-CoA thioester hydrolase
MAEPARLHLKVRHHEVDAYGHVNHAHYVHYLESARVEVLESLGLGLPEMRVQGFLILAAELSIKYHAPAYAAETLEVTTSIREVRGARSHWRQVIREVASDRLVVTADVTGAFTTENGRPVRIPRAIVEKLSTILIPDA